jgi:hypothetical protein
MSDRSQLLAQTYALPTPAPSVQPGAQHQYVDEIGNPESGLQQVDGITSEYFDKWAALKGFAREAQETLGVDVRYPDPSVPESNRLNRIYLKALADLKKQGERLKTGQKMYEGALSRNDLINANPSSDYFDKLQPGNDVVDKELDPIVTEANNKLQQLYFGNAIDQAKQYYGEIKSTLEKRRDSIPSQAAYWQRQIDALTPPTQAVREFAPWHGWKPDKEDTKRKGKINAAGQFVKKVANMMEGTTEGYELSSTEFGPNGERVWVNKDLTEGVKYGNGAIKEWQFIPSTGQSFMVVERDGPIRADGSVSKVIERVPLTGGDAVSIAKTIGSENPRFGADGETIDEYADQAGYFSEAGEVNPDVLVNPEYRKGQYEKMSKVEKELAKKKEKAQFDKLFNELDNMKAGAFGLTGAETKEFKLPNGKVLEIFRGNKGYYLENVDDLDLGPAIKAQFKQGGSTQPVPLELIKKFIVKSGGHLELQVDEPTPTGTKPATTTAPTDSVGTTNRKAVL